MNFGDTHQRENRYVAERATPFVLGGEVAGTVATPAEGFEAGERVVGLLETGGLRGARGGARQRACSGFPTAWRRRPRWRC